MKRGLVIYIFLFVFLISFVSSAAVSCEDLMASTGKSAETLCKVNYAGQCCNQNTDTSITYSNDYSGYVCTDHPTAGVCEIQNQREEVYKKISDRMDALGNTEQVWKMSNDEIQAEIDYYNNIYLPKDREIQSEFEACLDTKATNCYEIWKAKWDVINLAEANYQLSLVNQLYKNLGGISSGSKTSIGSVNQNTNRGRDEFGRMNPSIGGYLENAYVERADGTKVIPGHELYLQLDDTVKSGPGSKINIIFSHVGQVSLGENTELKVGNALLDQFYLAKGTLKSKVNFATPDKFEIDTPNSKVFVRGTEYIIDYNETTGTTTIYLSEGVLEITALNKNMTLQAGNYLIIYTNRTTETRSMNPEEWKSLETNFYEPLTNKSLVYGIWTIIILELIFIAGLRFWTDRKIKKPNKKDKSVSKGMIGLVLGILGILLFLLPYFGLVLSAIALSLSRIQIANNPSKYATWGRILGIVGIILNAIVLLSVGVVLYSA